MKTCAIPRNIKTIQRDSIKSLDLTVNSMGAEYNVIMRIKYIIMFMLMQLRKFLGCTNKVEEDIIQLISETKEKRNIKVLFIMERDINNRKG